MKLLSFVGLVGSFSVETIKFYMLLILALGLLNISSRLLLLRDLFNSGA